MTDAIAELHHHLAEAVRLRMISDVPLGVFLSGGVDSSAVVAFMARQIDRPIRTFSVGFEDAAFDERPYARLVSKHFDTDHTELIVKAPVTDILPRLIWHYDEPFGDSSAIPSYAIAQLTRQYVTVVLNGDGGDENFAGYDWYIMDRRLRHSEVVPLWLRQRIEATIQRLGPSWWQLRPFRKLAKLVAFLAIPPERRFARWHRHFSPDERLNLYTESYREAMPQSDPEGLFAEVFAQCDAQDCTDAALNADVQLYLADDLLVKMDRATMAHSLEARSPFLDHKLMEFVATLPPQFKLHGSQKKRLLKAALRGHLPDSILDRSKMGFSVPLARWFRQELREMTYDILLSKRAGQRGYFKPDAITLMLDAHCKGNEDHSDYLWNLLVLELWHRAFIDGDAMVYVES